MLPLVANLAQFLIGFIQSIFNKKRMEITFLLLTPFPAGNGVRFVAVPTAVDTRFAVCHFSENAPSYSSTASAKRLQFQY